MKRYFLTGVALSLVFLNHLSAALPTPWSDYPVGTPEIPGASDFDPLDQTFAITASGNALTSGADTCHLVAQQLSGDFDLTATLDSITSDSPDALAGITYRSTLAEGSPAISLLALPGDEHFTIAVAIRDTADAAPAITTFETTIELTAPVQLKLSRVGMTINAHYLSEDSEWIAAGSLRVHNTLAGYAGMILTSDSDEEDATAIFSSVALVALGALGVGPIADTYVQGDNTLHGSETTMVIKLGEGQYGRESFLRFDLSHLEPPRSALLRLYLANRHHTPADQLIALKSYHNIE